MYPTVTQKADRCNKTQLTHRPSLCTLGIVAGPWIPRIAVAQPGGGVAVRGPCPWSAAPARRCSNFCPIPPGQELPALLLLFLLLSPLPPSRPVPCPPPGALFPGSFSSRSPPGGVAKRRRAWGAEGGAAPFLAAEGSC